MSEMAVKGLELSENDPKLFEWKRRMLERRSERIRPRLDDKILLGWNALMITACCKAFAALGDEGYRSLALKKHSFPGGKNERRRRKFFHPFL
ncbi:MAG: hypothetical protein WDM78_22345 [Puia sp.]